MNGHAIRMRRRGNYFGRHEALYPARRILSEEGSLETNLRIRKFFVKITGEALINKAFLCVNANHNVAGADPHDIR